MNIPFLNSFFKPKVQEKKTLMDFSVFKKLKTVCEKNDILVYENITIYHHSNQYNIPLLVLDPYRGISVFEYKTWSYDELKGAKATTSQNVETSENSLAFEKKHNIIKQKLKELTHTDDVDIFNFLLMENLSTQDYENLDTSLQELLPDKKIIFSDSNDDEIIQKLQDVKEKQDTSLDTTNIMGNLLIQYLVISKDNSLHIATDEQKKFIEDDDETHQTLYGKKGSGKTNAILLKALLYKLKNPQNKPIIVSPTTLSCDMLKQKLLTIVEHAIIEIDITDIQILTPEQLKKNHPTKKFLGRSKISDMLICDDSNLMDEDFMFYLNNMQKKSKLILVSDEYVEDATFTFHQNFYYEDLKRTFIKTNPYAKTLHIISNLLKENNSQDILIISNKLSKKQLNEDLEFFIKDDTFILDSSKNLIDQDLDNLLLASYDETSSLDADFTILLDINDALENQLKYAINIAKKHSFILYESENEAIIELQQHYTKDIQ